MVRHVQLDDQRVNDKLDAKIEIPKGFLSAGEASHSIRGYFKKVIGKAVLIEMQDVRARRGDAMLPLSQIHIKRLDDGNRVEVYMKRWLYEKTI